MPKTPKAPAKPDTRTQQQRFEDFAREHGADDAEALDRAFGDMDPKKKPSGKDESAG